ncbi:hypothetical protein ASO20_00535 [Mycoplasma sp. (ex Biomphalaria glabrata)]|uniref:hypothetical protein n=1 Tax=Mycoplasma sp. (ex Biomphalaria glabrata) TaxID=1749074 RepID=UPI00073ABE45|nr:hypothetical protein [Mycoplasma sp. (ex Biomphalaria glabrata)]ALV23163.1 hypothetical protein ASO20_00535 [Mycoplasma sp. (ex Biomphalaria glabrata)]
MGHSKKIYQVFLIILLGLFITNIIIYTIQAITQFNFFKEIHTQDFHWFLSYVISGGIFTIIGTFWIIVMIMRLHRCAKLSSNIYYLVILILVIIACASTAFIVIENHDFHNKLIKHDFSWELNVTLIALYFTEISLLIILWLTDHVFEQVYHRGLSEKLSLKSQ